MVSKLPYDVLKDFQPIVQTATNQMLLAASLTAPFHTVRELIDYAKKNPGKLFNASSGNGTPGHVGFELFKFMTGTKSRMSRTRAARRALPISFRDRCN